MSQVTRIPEVHLRALEDDRPEDLPEGPYRAAYTRAVCALLELDVPEHLEEVQLVERAIPLWGVRLIASLSVALVVGLMLSIGWQQWGPAATTTAMPVAPDQLVVLTARQSTRIVAWVDGELSFNRIVSGGETVELAGHERIEINVPQAKSVRVEYNGDTVRPQGRQDAPRRLVFVDDVGQEP